MTREEAIRRIKAWNLDSDDREVLAVVIPELAESEDERIRKGLIEALKASKTVGELKYIFPEPTREECIAYLEKLKETGIRWFKSDNVKNPDKPYIDKAGMFYTTDGRMCYASEIEKQKEQSLRNFIDDFPYSIEQKEQKPADLPAGFYVTLPDGKKYYAKEMRCNGMNIKVVEPKPAEWNEEDKMILESLISLTETISEYYISLETRNGYVAWLKSLPERFNIQPKLEWNESDKQNINLIISYLDSYIKEHNDTFGADECKYLKYWLKSLPLNLKKKNEGVAKLCSNEWSEEDDVMFDKVCCLINPGTKLTDDNSDYCAELKQWIVSLRERMLKFLRPQPHWKPSEEQMEMLKCTIGYYGSHTPKELVSLYEQLKKL